MVTTQHEKVLWIFDLVRQKQAYRLQALLTPVHVVPTENRKLKFGRRDKLPNKYHTTPQQAAIQTGYHKVDAKDKISRFKDKTYT